jgi:hypothetical protein
VHPLWLLSSLSSYSFSLILSMLSSSVFFLLDIYLGYPAFFLENQEPWDADFNGEIKFPGDLLVAFSGDKVWTGDLRKLPPNYFLSIVGDYWGEFWVSFIFSSLISISNYCSLILFIIFEIEGSWMYFFSSIYSSFSSSKTLGTSKCVKKLLV